MRSTLSRSLLAAMQTEVDRAIGDYAEQAAAMTALEMTTLAQVIQTLDQSQ